MKINALLFCFCFSVTVFAQNYDFGKVSKEELEEKYNSLDSSATAAYLYKYRKTYFTYDQSQGFRLITDVHDRIKIYNQEGFDYATRQIRLHKNGGNQEKFTSLKAYTYNLVEGKVNDTKLEKDGIFQKELYKYQDEVKFTMPDLKEGSVIEYKYSVISPFFSNVEDYVFQHDIPIKKLEATFETPEYFNFKINAKGYLRVTPKIETKYDKITFTNKQRGNASVTNAGSSGTSYSTSYLNFSKTITSYDLLDIPALKNEPYVNNIDNYRTTIQYELSYIKFPQSPVEYYSTTWEDVVKKIYDSPDFGNELNKSGYYEEDIDALIGSVSNPKQRIDLIYSFVKSKVKWNNYYGYYTMDGVKNAYKNQVGNVAEINLMLTSMLKYAGLNAYPVLVSTRQNGIPLFPTREGYNYVITYVKLPEEEILLDASSLYSTPNVLPLRAVNWQGRVIAEQGGSAVLDLIPKEKSQYTVSMLVDLDGSGNIEGGQRCVMTNHDALLYRDDYNHINKEDFIEKLENKYSNLEISDFEVKNSDDLSKPVLESYKFALESQADIIGDKFYFSPLFFLRIKENPFKLEKREFPIDFGYLSSRKYNVIINLPEGYKVESVPESLAIALDDNLGSFQYKILASDSKIQMVVDTEFNTPIISPIYYEALKEFFKQIIEKENEQIVLTKI